MLVDLQYRRRRMLVDFAVMMEQRAEESLIVCSEIRGTCVRLDCVVVGGEIVAAWGLPRFEAILLWASLLKSRSSSVVCYR